MLRSEISFARRGIIGKQVQRIMEATSASLNKGEPIIRREIGGINDIRPQSNLNDYEGDIGAGFDAYGVNKSADTRDEGAKR